jgi:hypothetical protein
MKVTTGTITNTETGNEETMIAYIPESDEEFDQLLDAAEADEASETPDN